MTDASRPLAALDDRAHERLRPQGHPSRVDAMLATLVDEPFSDPGWIYERKLDGMRLLVHRHGDDVWLQTRNHESRTAALPELTDAVAHLETDDLVADGEVVAFDGATTSFARLQGRIGLDDPDAATATGIAVWLYLFDLLHLDGHDTTGLALRDRKRLLKRAVRFADPIRFTPHRDAAGERYLAEACARGWEGLIAKDATAPYRSGRSRRWQKLKCQHGQELVIGGWTDPEGKRTGLGALLVGYHDHGELIYAGKVGTGFSRAVLTELRDRLDELARSAPPFVDAPSQRGVHWVEPRLVAQIGFTEWTRDGRLRHPRYEGLRTDKDPADVVRERPS